VKAVFYSGKDMSLIDISGEGMVLIAPAFYGLVAWLL
jgi:hypothetical protein